METGALTGERGAYRLTQAIQAIEVPATVQVVLAARIDRLPAEDKHLLQTASVIGSDVPVVLLHAIAEAGGGCGAAGLARLQAAEFLYETRLFPDPEYTFKHALTHDVTYGTLLQRPAQGLARPHRRRHRTLLSGPVARARRSVWPTMPCGASCGSKAVTYLRQAGVKALARSANREAVSCFEQALTALGHLPETRGNSGAGHRSSL